MITWIETLSDWDRKLPATLIAEVAGDRRHSLLATVVQKALDLEPESVRVEHESGQAPRVVRPPESGLFLSLGARGAITAIGMASSSIGVDVEAVDQDGEIPWNVLHPTEAEMLRDEDTHRRAQAFARLWSLKEAYVKARGLGLFYEPSSFAVRFVNAEAARIDDDGAPARVAAAETRWRIIDDDTQVAVSTVVLEPLSRRP